MRALESACVWIGVCTSMEGVEVLELLQTRSGSAQRSEVAQRRDSEGILSTELPAGGALQRSLEPATGAGTAGLPCQRPDAVPARPPRSTQTGDLWPRHVSGAARRRADRGGCHSERDAAFAEGLTPDGQQQLQRGITALLPVATGWPPMERWWGFRPCTPDEGPLLGPGPLPGLWLACGHHRNGVLLAAITAELARQMPSQQ